MEKKLYIPTSSLNFNCIIANESISPGILYPKRAFGMKRFVDIFNRKNANTIILTDYPAQFNRPPSDVEDHPMLMEVYIDEGEITAIGNGYYTIDKTLYITPYNTRFIFFNEQDRLTTESLSNHSLDVKLSRLYIPQMVVEHYSEKYNFPQIILPDTVSNLNSLTNDDRINRLKGMLYGYYIGAWLSSDKTSRAFKNTTQCSKCILCSNIKWKEQRKRIARTIEKMGTIISFVRGTSKSDHEQC